MGRGRVMSFRHRPRDVVDYGICGQANHCPNQTMLSRVARAERPVSPQEALVTSRHSISGSLKLH